MQIDPDGVHVTSWGDGPLAVLLHGGGPGGEISFAAQRPLAERWHLVLPDRPGHGGSPRRGRDDFDRDADLLTPLLSDGAHLVGHSYGGIVALGMAARSPRAVRSLTLIEPPAYRLAPDDPDVRAMMRANQEFFADPPAAPVDRMRGMFALVGIERPVPDPLPDFMVRGAEEMTDIRGPDEAEVDPDVLVEGGYPILVLTSGRLPGFEGVARALVEHAGARHVVVPGTDHSVQEAGQPVNELLENLWSSAE